MAEEQDRCTRGDLSPLIVRSIIDSMALGLMVIDPKGRIVVANQALSVILAIPRAELLSKGWGQLFIDSESNIEFNQVFIDVVWSEIQNLQRTVAYFTPDGRSRILNVTSSFLSAQGEMEGVVLLMEDVTETVQLHEREKQMLGAMNRLQTERTQGLNKLALSVAHQIRNPMMTIGGFASLMLKTNDRSEQDLEHLGIIREELHKLERMVRAVVEYASIPAVKRKLVPMDSLLRRAVDQLHERARNAGAAMGVRLDCRECTVLADAAMLARAMEELLMNSLEAGSPEVLIALRQENEGEQTKLHIEDKGEGIKEDYLPFVFDPFFTTRGQKVGMGLSLAQRIVQEHQGSIAIESIYGKGTTVTLLLPRE